MDVSRVALNWTAPCHSSTTMELREYVVNRSMAVTTSSWLPAQNLTLKFWPVTLFSSDCNLQRGFISRCSRSSLKVYQHPTLDYFMLNNLKVRFWPG